MNFSKIALLFCFRLAHVSAHGVQVAHHHDGDGGLPGAETQTTRRLAGGFSLVAQENGKVFLSVNGKGHTGSGLIGVLKPSPTAVVRKAFLFATTNRGNADVSLNGLPITWDGTASNSNYGSFYADVTSVVKQTVDAATTGELFISVVETTNAGGTDGEVLAVIFEDPSALVSDNSVSLLFGALNQAGDSFAINLASPITAADLSNPDLTMDMSIGIGFGYQSGSYGGQFSLVVSGRLYRDTRKAARLSLSLFVSICNRT
jgi:hypothetical protein